MLLLLVFILFTHIVSSTLSNEELDAICDISADNNIGISACPNATTRSICGVPDHFRCDEYESTIRSLILPGNQFLGTLSTNIGRLRNITYIDFSENNFDALPNSLFGLTKLTHLSLNSNRLQGAIPTQIGQLSSLKSLLLGKNNFVAIPTQIGYLNNLTELYLYDNNINTIPLQLFNLVNLTYLNLGNNPFNGSGIPNQIGKLTRLEILDLTGGYDIMGFGGPIPATINQLTSLKELILIKNQLTGTLPIQFENFKNLTKLDLSLNEGLNVDNLFNFDLPVEELYLSLVNLGSVPSTINRFKRLKRLSLGGLELPTIPNELAELPLTHLDLSGNHLSNIGELLKNLTMLSSLNLGGNRLEGTVPTQLGKLKSLTYLNLQSNYFNGTIPSQLGMLANLTELIVDTNLKCPTIYFQPNEAFKKVCGGSNDINSNKDITLNGTVFIPNVAITQGATLTGKDMNLSTQSLELSSNSIVKLNNSTISVSGNTTISTFSMILDNENKNQPAISTTGCLNIQPNTELSVTFSKGLPQTNQNLFSFACKTGNFSRVQVNGQTCNFVLTNNFASYTRADCTGSGEGKTTNLFFFFVLIFILIFVI